MRRIIDISLPLSPTLPRWPGDPSVTVEPVTSLASGDPVNISRLTLGTHTGTHVDAPAHLLADGKPIDAVPLDWLSGPCWVCELTEIPGHITAEDLQAREIPPDTERLLLKTRNSRLWERPDHPFDETFIGITPDAAAWIVERGIRLVGIDYLSIEPFDADGSTHRILLGAEVAILEGVDLRPVNAGPYELLCLPLKIPGGDGAPARAVLLAPEPERRP